ASHDHLSVQLSLPQATAPEFAAGMPLEAGPPASAPAGGAAPPPPAPPGVPSVHAALRPNADDQEHTTALPPPAYGTPHPSRPTTPTEPATIMSTAPG